MTLEEKYRLAIQNLQAIAQYNDSKPGYVDEWTQAEAFMACRTAARRALEHLREPTELPNHTNVVKSDDDHVSLLSRVLHTTHEKNNEDISGHYEMIALDDSAEDDFNREVEKLLNSVQYCFIDPETKASVREHVLELMYGYVEAGRFAGTPEVDVQVSGDGCIHIRAYSSTKMPYYA